MSNEIGYRRLADLLADKGVIDAYSIALPKRMDRFADGGHLSDSMYLLAALAAEHTLVGKHDCLDLSKRKRLSQVIDELPADVADVELPQMPREVPFPLVVFKGRLYLERYAHYEWQVAEALAKRGRNNKPLVADAICNGVLRESEGFKMDENQKNAIETALKQSFTVITGGPGTGKTTILCAILVALKRKKRDLRIFACAPTGKAQARMMEAIKDEFRKGHVQSVDGEDAGSIVTQHGTIHRLLGWRPGNKFAHNGSNLLEADLVVVDEVSMADISLMAKLLEAIPEKAGVILMGDRDQLSSVETGAVLADICDAWKGSRAIAELKVSHRFRGDGKIASVKTSIGQCDADATIDSLRTAGEDVVWFERGDVLKGVETELAKIGARSYLDAADPIDALAKFESFRIICAERKGLRGVANLNAHVQEWFGVGKYEKGYPVIVSENAADIGLFNGDVLICWPDLSDGGRIKAWILDADGNPKSYPIAQLPEHLPAFAMTIHKSQGSGFDHVLMILPEDVNSPLLTRELFYTGLTRTKKSCRIWASEAAIRKTVMTQTIRDSGLSERLRLP